MHKQAPSFSHRETPRNTAARTDMTKTDHLFKVLRKCNGKFDCLVCEMLHIKPSLNKQAEFNRAKLFIWQFSLFLIVFITVGIIPIGRATISCIISHFIYSYYTFYFFTFYLDNGVKLRRNVGGFVKCVLKISVYL